MMEGLKIGITDTQTMKMVHWSEILKTERLHRTNLCETIYRRKKRLIDAA